jgi:hypothetical protein
VISEKEDSRAIIGGLVKRVIMLERALGKREKEKETEGNTDEGSEDGEEDNDNKGMVIGES